MTESSLLIIHQGALGDVVLTFPAIIGLRKKFSRIDVLSQRQPGKLAAHLGLVEKWYPLEAACFATLFSDQIDGKIKDLICRYTTILVFSFSCDLKKSISQITDSQCFQIPPRPPAQDKIHVAEFLFKNLIDCGLLETADSNYEIFTLQRKQNQRTGRPIDASKIIIHPGSGSIRKRWPLAQFLKLADVLKKRGLRPQFICGPAESDLMDKLQNQNRNVRNLSELTELVDLLQSAGGYVGNDSGVSHLAAFLGLPTAVIFGPADPIRWKPVGPSVAIVHPELDCSPCFEIESENCSEPRCLTDASLESVLKALDHVY
jgi:ADP-heptose:LPS heptosyltransferase